MVHAATAERFSSVFASFDCDADGKISAAELRGCMRATLGEDVPAEEAEALVASADADGDGFISLEEFAALNATAPGDDEEDLRLAFKVFDADGSGDISAAELASVLHGLGEKATVQQCRRMIEGVDKNGDGLISFDEFKVMMASGLAAKMA